MSTTPHLGPRTREEWTQALDSLPEHPAKIPVFFFGHGSPMLAMPDNGRSSGFGEATMKYNGPNGPNARFLKDFGPALLKKYSPKAIVVFSAHWDTRGERLGSYPKLDVDVNMKLTHLQYSVGLRG